MVLFGTTRIWDNSFYRRWKVLSERRVLDLKEKKCEGGEIRRGRMGDMECF
jgi:hypothetical protein